MKINVTEHERTLMADALINIGTVIALALASKILTQDPANDGPEVAILSVSPVNRDGWDQ